jgi:peptidoglycan/xylan/chitin deacetylase (PgdA/CDA1 family)
LAAGGKTLSRQVTLTFDNGPDIDVTPRILDELERRELHATFFVVGSALKKEGALEIARRAQAEGHWIGNHTMTHGTPLGMRSNDKAAIDEVAEMQTLLGTLAHPRKFFRPNAGKGRLGPHMLSAAVIDHLCAQKYTAVTWNSVPRDWETPLEGWVARALADVEQRESTLLVLHDIGRSGAALCLGAFLDELGRRGVDIVQDFPDECLPIKSGQVTEALGELLSL